MPSGLASALDGGPTRHWSLGAPTETSICAFIGWTAALWEVLETRGHAGSVLAYVLSGEIRSENSATGPARVYKAGETFFEPPGSEHLVSENASATEPASLLAIFVADDGAQLTIGAK